MTWTKDAALRQVILQLNNRFEKPMIASKNKFGHALIQTANSNYYFIFKKDFFNSFSQVFKDYGQKQGSFNGVGESINREYIKLCLDNKAELLVCYEKYEGIVYCLDKDKLDTALNIAYPGIDLSMIPNIAKLKIYCDYHGLVRTQDKENEYKTNDYTDSTILVNEQTYSFPVKLLKRF